MKKKVLMITVLLALVLVMGGIFAACSDKSAKETTNATTNETTAAVETTTEVETTAASTEPKQIKLNEPVELPFVTLTFTETGFDADISKSIKTGNVTRNFGPEPIEGKKFIYINGTIKNTGKAELPVYDFFIGEFDIDGYKFSCDANSTEVYNSQGETQTMIEPLGEYEFFMYAEVADELADSNSAASFRLGFYDNFDNEEMSKNKAFEDDAISMCPYYYTINLK